MAPAHFNSVQKKWMAGQLRRAASLKTLAGVQKYQKSLLEKMFDGEKDTKPRSLTAGDATVDQVVEIFGLKFSGKRWEQREEIYDAPRFLTYGLKLLKKALYDTSSEAYNRIAIDYLIVACIARHRDILSRLSTNDPTAVTAPTLEQSKLSTNDPTAVTAPMLEQSELPTNSLHDQTATIVPVLYQAPEIAGPSSIAPTTPLIAPKDTSQPLPIKVFTEMSLSVQVEKGGQEWLVTGKADWAMGYGDRAALEDGTVLLAIEAKQRETFSNAQAQLLAYLATIRQLRIQANKKNVTTQGFYSDGEIYSFMCIRNDGTVMKSRFYEISYGPDLKSVFNFLLGMLITAAESSPKTSPTKPGPEQDEEIGNFNRDVFVRVFDDDFDIPTPIFGDVDMEEADEWSDVELPEEE